MLSHRQIRFISSLQQKKHRKAHGIFTAEGSKLVLELMQSRLEIHSVYATQDWIQKHTGLLQTFKGDTTKISSEELSRITTLKTASQVIALVQIPSPIFNPEFASDQLILMLDNISDPGNLGTILRTADWFGIQHVICSPDTVDLFNPKTVQATMGSIGRVTVYYHDLGKLLASIEPTVPVYGSLLTGKSVAEIDPERTGILIIGNEAHGIAKDLHHFITHPLTIPPIITGKAGIHRPESLNAAIAAAILCWEFKRNYKPI